MLEVVKADCAGSCYGVQRALDLARKAADSGKTAQTLGPLIHNPQVVHELESSGVTVAHEPSDVTAESVVIRSHGVTPQVRSEVDALGVDVVDATCPHVLRAQRAARDLALEGRTVIVVGEESHPEVEGLRAWAEEAGGRVIVAARAADLPDAIDEPVGIVVQTTQRREKLDDVVSALRARDIEPEIADTICNATTSRQGAAADLAARVDAMVVVGGKNSSNTTRLYEICAGIAPVAYHIETLDDLPAHAFAGMQRVGVTAGASTPEEQIDAVVDAIRNGERS